MTRSGSMLALIAALGLGLAAGEVAAINKCVDKKGKVSYQDGKCPDDAKQDVIKVAPAATSGAPAAAAESKAPLTPDEDKEDQRMLDAVATQSTYEGCGNVSPDFASRHAATYQAWRAANAEVLARVERSPRYQQVLENGRKQMADQVSRTPGANDKVAKFCEVQFIPMLRRTLAK